MYAAVLCSSYPDKVQQLCVYQTMIVREAQRCGGKGWLLYDQMFRQQAAMSVTDWSKLNNSLNATTFLQQQNGRGRTCIHCMETDHVSNECSLAPLWPERPSAWVCFSVSADSEEKGNKGRSSKICYSWNDGQCAIGPYCQYCQYCHICAKCSSSSHKVMHCTTYPSARQPQRQKSKGVSKILSSWTGTSNSNQSLSFATMWSCIYYVILFGNIEIIDCKITMISAKILGSKVGHKSHSYITTTIILAKIKWSLQINHP